MRTKFTTWLAAAVLVALAPVAITHASAGSPASRQENARLKQEIASLRQQLQQQGADCRPSQASAKAKTLKQWYELLVGKLDRSQVIALLGAPGTDMAAMLSYEGLVFDPDTGRSHRLTIIFKNATGGGSGKVTHVSF